MARNKRGPRRLTPPDPIYNNRQISKLINRSMKDGKKSLAERQVYAAFDLVKSQTNQDSLEVFEAAIRQITPQLEVRSRRVGGAAYQVPMPVKGPRGFSLAIRWLVTEARKRPNSQSQTYAQKLAAELISAAKGEGGAVQKKITTHKMADANRAFSHFRW